MFLGRFVAFFRAVMPALAGASRMRYPKFLAFNAAGGLVWGVGFTLLGFLAGNSYKTIESNVGSGAAIAVASSWWSQSSSGGTANTAAPTAHEEEASNQADRDCRQALTRS